MQNVCLKSRARDVCGRFVVAVSFADGNVVARHMSSDALYQIFSS